MTEAALQIVLLLAFLAIGLLSVTFPIYAICVTYLREEKKETEKELKKRLDEVKSAINSIAKDLPREPDLKKLKDIEKIRNRYESEQDDLKLRVNYLTLNGAVLRPVFFLAVALGFASIGIYFYYEGVIEALAGFGIMSAVFLMFTMYNLYKTLSAVEKAALRPARTVDFKVMYDDHTTSKEIKLGKETEITIGAVTDEAELDNFELWFGLNPDLELLRILNPDAQGYFQPSSSFIPNYVSICREKRHVARNTVIGAAVEVKAKKIGEYEIPFRICAEGIVPVKGTLLLKVVK